VSFNISLISLFNAREQSRRCVRHGVAGFTLVEMIGVMVIMSILLFVAAPRFFDHNTFDVRLFEDRIQTMLQYAQKTAIAQNRKIYVRLNGSSVALCLDATCSDDAHKLAAPGGSSGSCGGSANAFWMCEGIPAGVTLSPATAGFFFNALGKPFDTGGASLSAQLDIAVTADGQSHHVYVEQETGYVHR
jgi:MSHA pilin protein MshC